jgi:hypothetical protein
MSRLISYLPSCVLSSPRVLASIEHEGGSQVHRIVVHELCYGQPVSPVILLVVDKDAEKLFYLLVHVFGLAICLQVVSRGWVLLNTK